MSPQIDSFCPFALNDVCKHWDRTKEAEAVSEYDADPPAVTRNHHDGRTLAGTEVTTPVSERGQIDGNQCQDEALSTSSADDQPSLMHSILGRFASACASLEQSASVLVEG